MFSLLSSPFVTLIWFSFPFYLSLCKRGDFCLCFMASKVPGLNLNLLDCLFFFLLNPHSVWLRSYPSSCFGLTVQRKMWTEETNTINSDTFCHYFPVSPDLSSSTHISKLWTTSGTHLGLGFSIPRYQESSLKVVERMYEPEEFCGGSISFNYAMAIGHHEVELVYVPQKTLAYNLSNDKHWRAER